MLAAHFAPAQTASIIPNTVTTEAPVGKSHFAEAYSPKTLARNPKLQPIIKREVTLLTKNIAHTAGTTK